MGEWNPGSSAGEGEAGGARVSPHLPFRTGYDTPTALLSPSVIHTYPDVGQFWTYKPEEFLKNPVYDRDTFPGCRYCE